MPVSEQQEEAVILERQERVSRLYLQEYTQRQIASILNISASTVCRDLADIKQRWIESADETTAQRLNKKVAELAQIKNEAWRAWKASKQERETKTAETTTGEGEGGGKKTKTGIRKEQRDPAYEYMKIVQWCWEKERDLFGLAVTKIALTNPDGTKEFKGNSGMGVMVLDLTKLTDEQLDQLDRMRPDFSDEQVEPPKNDRPEEPERDRAGEVPPIT